MKYLLSLPILLTALCDARRRSQSSPILVSTTTERCHEGFNATALGVPLYHWEEKHCHPCFMQELTFPFLKTDFNVSIRYGGCVAPAYVGSLTCEKLFGEDSDLKPATVLNMVSTLDSKFYSLEREFRGNTTENYRLLFSNGFYPLQSFIDGAFAFLSNLGLNTTKAEPLKSTLQKLMDLTLPKDIKTNHWGWHYDYNRTAFDGAIAELMDVLQTVANAYEPDYPNSELPAIVRKIVHFLNDSKHRSMIDDCVSSRRDDRGLNTIAQPNDEYDYNYENYEDIRQCQIDAKENRDIMLSEAAVDLQYAINDLFNYKTMDIYEILRKSFPDFSVFIQLLQILDRRDMKSFVKDSYKLAMLAMRRPINLRSAAEIYNNTVEKLSSKFHEFTEIVRNEFAPRTCKFMSCTGDLCNTHERLSSVNETVTKFKPTNQATSMKSVPTQDETTTKPISTTSSSGTIRENYAWNLLAAVLPLCLCI